jgi:hypothetical protein
MGNRRSHIRRRGGCLRDRVPLCRTVHPPARIRSSLGHTRRRRVWWALAKERQCRWETYRGAGADLDERYTMSDPEHTDAQLLEATMESFPALREVLNDVQGACDALPEAEQQRYRDAQQSVVDARRSAETHEGLLQVC